MLRRAGVLRWTFLVIASDGAFCGGRFELYVLLLSMDYGRGDWLPPQSRPRRQAQDCVAGGATTGLLFLIVYVGALRKAFMCWCILTGRWHYVHATPLSIKVAYFKLFQCQDYLF